MPENLHYFQSSREEERAHLWNYQKTSLVCAGKKERQREGDPVILLGRSKQGEQHSDPVFCQTRVSGALRVAAISGEMLLDGIARGGAARGDADFAVDGGEMPVDRAWADD